MKNLKTLILMQIRDKIDLPSNRKELLRLLFINIIKFLVVAVIVYLIFYLLTFAGVFTYDETVDLLVIVVTATMILSILSCTFGLMKSLYFADDNKVLITLPVKPNLIFISKIIVFYLYEIKKNLMILIPIFLSGALMMITRHLLNPLVLLWMILPMIFILAVPVLIGSLLSIPLMYIYKFLKRHQVLEVILTFIAVVLAVVLIVYLIGLIPPSIDLNNQWPFIKGAIKNFISILRTRVAFFSQMVNVMFGEYRNLEYRLVGMTFVKFAILVGSCIILFVLAYFISRPLFFKMMASNFETNKGNVKIKQNVRRSKYFTFINKEFTINIRSIDISLNYLIVYIAVPILIMFLNAMYRVMDTRKLGDLLVYSFNVLLICLPLLASNALVATYYSKEGRAGYLKRTKPIYALYPLFTKLFFNILFSIPTVFITVSVFGIYVGLKGLVVLIFGFAVLFLHLGHMIYSAMLDIMNPQNEQYATVGTTFDNPNENKSTLLAFILSAIFALIAYKFLSESAIGGADSSLVPGMLKLMIVAGIYLFSNVLLFVKRVRAFYYELQG